MSKDDEEMVAHIADDAIVTGDVLWKELARRFPLTQSTSVIVDMVFEASCALARVNPDAFDLFEQTIIDVLKGGQAQGLQEARG